MKQEMSKQFYEKALDVARLASTGEIVWFTAYQPGLMELKVQINRLMRSVEAARAYKAWILDNT